MDGFSWIDRLELGHASIEMDIFVQKLRILSDRRNLFPFFIVIIVSTNFGCRDSVCFPFVF